MSDIEEEVEKVVIEPENEINVKGYFRKRDGKGRVVFTKEYDFTVRSLRDLTKMEDLYEDLTKD